MTATYDILLVLYSFLLAAIASYFALGVAQIIIPLKTTASRLWWITTGGFGMALGIWSMHFIGMGAYKLPISLVYDPYLTLASILPAMASAGLFLWIMALPENPDNVWQTRSLAAFVIGIGIATMHYTGMGAIQVSPPIKYDSVVVLASIFVAITVSFMTISIVSLVRKLNITGVKVIGVRMIAAMVMGLALALIHYTGMAAAGFDATSQSLPMAGFTPDKLHLLVGTFSIILMGTGISLASSKESLQRREEVIADYRLANEALYHAATRDPLTDCHNRRYFEEVAASAIERERRELRPLALMMIDIDHFKKINDTYGHGVGDRALCHVVAVIRDQLRNVDLLARIGGEEFTVLLTDIDYDNTHMVAERIRSTLATSPFYNDDKLISLTISIGVAWAKPSGIPGLDELVRAADQALYHAKRGGRNRYKIFAVSTEEEKDDNRVIPQIDMAQL